MSRRSKTTLIVLGIAAGAVAAGWAFREKFEDDDERSESSERMGRKTAAPSSPATPAPPTEKR